MFTINATTGLLTAVVVNTTSNSLATLTYTLPTGCIRTTPVTINRQPAAIYGGTGRVCTGSTLAQLSGTTGCTWSSANPSVATISATGVVTGVAGGNVIISYTSAAGCAAQREITVNATPAVITGATSVIVGATTTLANTTVGGTWSSSTTSRATIGSASGIVTGVSVGTTNITYMMPTGCFATRAMGTAAARGVEEELVAQEVSEMKIYPNPTSGNITIATDNTGTFNIYTMDGRIVETRTITDAITSITLPNTLPAGYYVCQFIATDGTQKIVRILYQP
jgi:hypothetical protein